MNFRPRTVDDLEAGDGASVMYQDGRLFPGTVISRSKNTVTWQADVVTGDPGVGYSFTRNPNSEVIIFTRRANGRWVWSIFLEASGPEIVPSRSYSESY